MAHITNAEDTAHIPTIVKTQPFPMAAIQGAPTIAAAHEKILRQRLFSAMPPLERRGMNSVNIVVVIAKINILPMP